VHLHTASAASERSLCLSFLRFNVYLHTSTASSLYLSQKCTITFSTASERKPLSLSEVHQTFLRFNVHLHLLHSIREEAFISLGSTPNLPQVRCASSPSPQHQRGSLYLSPNLPMLTSPIKAFISPRVFK
jgi:hypothetical protein